MIKLQKKSLLVEVGEPLIFRHEPNGNHNEVTVAVIKYAIPIIGITRNITAPVLKKIEKVAMSDPSAGIRFNFKYEAPAILFICKRKTERRGNDAHNQELADKIAIAKCRAGACRIGRRITLELAKLFEEEAQHLKEISESFNTYTERELSYINKELSHIDKV